ncbi:MAG TPA: hypothetical protein V6D16_23045 [Candidatus Obscuribacterales bacterium]
MEITKKERDRLIQQISKASGVAQYALKEKMTDEQVIQASQHLAILALVKDANNFNRYKQGLKTQEANEKLKAFLNPQHSEILSAGKWLLNALSKSGSDRKQTLLEKELVHKEDYNDTVIGMRDSVTEIAETSEEAIAEAQAKIAELEKRIDTLKSQLSKIQTYISSNYGAAKWQAIKKTFNIR